MPDSATLDYAGVVLFCRVVGATQDILKLSDNFRYELNVPDGDHLAARWEHPYSHAHESPILVLTFGNDAYSAQGWIFGSGNENHIADIQLTKDNRSAVSRRHLKVDINPASHLPRFTNLSRNAVRVHNGKGQTVELEKDMPLDMHSTFQIDFGALQLDAWRPSLNSDEMLCFKENAENFSKEFLEALPSHDHNLARSEADTFVQRFGQGNTVYKRHGVTENTGSFATVIKVMELKSRTCFAAKIPHFKAKDSVSRAHERWELLNKEYEKMARLSHPHIAQVVEVLTTAHIKQPPWLIIEWIDQDLNSVRLHDHDIPLLLRHVTNGLVFMHDQGLTHRDLKPANILLQLEGVRLTAAKIADFGTTASTARMYTYTGTSVYMAPEFFTEERSCYSSVVDLWSLGLIALELFTRWSADDCGWHARSPPTKPQHHDWVLANLDPRIEMVPQIFQPLLRGMLLENAAKRWTATASEQYLQTFSQNKMPMKTEKTEEEEHEAELEDDEVKEHEGGAADREETNKKMKKRKLNNIRNREAPT